MFIKLLAQFLDNIQGAVTHRLSYLAVLSSLCPVGKNSFVVDAGCESYGWFCRVAGIVRQGIFQSLRWYLFHTFQQFGYIATIAAHQGRKRCEICLRYILVGDDCWATRVSNETGDNWIIRISVWIDGDARCTS